MVTTRRCSLRNEWRTWTPQKRADRIFCVCPSCGVYGSHVERIKD